MVECTYCGILANTLDHVIPVSYNYVSRKNATYSKQSTIPCCNECNSFLSNKWLPTINERVEYLIKKYSSKYHKILSQPDWEDWEINELGESLKIMVKSNIKRKEYILERLSFMLTVHNQTELTPDDVWTKHPNGTYNKFKN
jgi:NMD protein affecting ribosome stability and mRNA decay